MARPTDTPQMLRDIDLARSVEGAHGARARGLPQFPVTLDLKTGAELCCVSSDITAR
ncbi:MAG: hypothetical protein WB721_16690 [Pseudolabrys sp.]|jgi:hypothetical protein